MKNKEFPADISSNGPQKCDELQQLLAGSDAEASDEAKICEETERLSADLAETDTILISRLRSGDNTAYTALWAKHVDAALRVARRITPNHAEDLVSEGFLALYQQIAVKKNGPDSAFRAYLFTVMRNIAARWYREGNLIEPVADIDEVFEDDGLRRLEEKTDAESMLVAFRALPERWQRVLWLVEVDEVPRPQIADEMGIKPNAVSVLYRRARTGLRLSWLEHQIPVRLRSETEHVAYQLPKLLMARVPGSTPREVKAHLARCSDCNALYADLQTSHKQMSGTLAIAGFAALGIGLPASTASLTVVGVGGGALAIGGLSLGSTLIAASVSLLLVGGTTTAGITALTQDGASGATSSQHESSRAQGHDRNDPTPPASAKPSGVGQGDSQSTSIGRGNHNTSINTNSFSNTATPNDSYTGNSHPKYTTEPLPDPDPESELRTGITSPLQSTGYLAPVLEGATQPGATVAIEITRPAGYAGGPIAATNYTVPADGAGAWSFDLRSVTFGLAARYEFRVWVILDGATSPADSGFAEVLPIEVAGFEGLLDSPPMPIAEASTSGVVFSVQGPANGTVCLASAYSGQASDIALDASGRATQRITLLSAGTYLLTFRVCEGEYRGPAFEQFVDVEDPDSPMIFGPWGPDPANTVFGLSAP